MKKTYIVKANSYMDALRKVKDSQFSAEGFEDRLINLYNALTDVFEDEEHAKAFMKKVYGSKVWTDEQEKVWRSFIRSL